MPLEQGSSRATIGRNIATELRAGKPRKQAIAIGLNTARRSMQGNPGKGAKLRKVGSIHAGFGHVASIRMGDEYPMDGYQDDDGTAEVSVHHGPKPKPLTPAQRNKPQPYKPRKTSRVHIKAEEAKQLKIGDRVRVSLHKHEG